MIVDETTWNDLAEYRESLEHHGVKGMKWYQHIFGKEQSHAKYPKGSSVGDSKKQSKAKEKEAVKRARAKAKAAAERAKQKAKEEKQKAKEEKQKAKADLEAAKKEKERQKILSDPTKLYKHRKEFTYEEIQGALKTFEWEKKLNGYSTDDLKRGATFINTILTYANNAINLWNTMARVVDAVPGNEGRMPIVRGVAEVSASNRNRRNRNNN